MERRELDDVDRFLTSVGKSTLYDYFGVDADASADDVEAAIKKRRSWAQGQQSNPKYKNEAISVIKLNALFRRLLLEEAPEYAAHVREGDSHRTLDTLTQAIRAAAGAGVLSSEQEAALLHQGRQLGLASAVVGQRIDDVLRELGARRTSVDGAPGSASSADHYEVLAIAETASAEEVEAAYRARYRWARSLMDVGKSARILQLLDEAWAELRDPPRRAEYDHHRSRLREMTDEVERRAASLMGLLASPGRGEPAPAALPAALPAAPPAAPPARPEPPRISLAPPPARPRGDDADGHSTSAPLPVAIHGRTLGVAAEPQNVRTRGPKLVVDSPDTVNLRMRRQIIVHSFTVRNAGPGRMMSGKVSADQDWIEVRDGRLQPNALTQTVSVAFLPKRMAWGKSIGTVTVATDHGERKTISFGITRPSLAFVIASGLAVAAAIGLLAGGGATWLAARRPPPQAPLVLVLDPAADRVLIDGEHAGSGGQVEVRDPKLDAPIRIRVDADGFESHDEIVTLHAGQQLRRDITLALSDPMDWAPPAGAVPATVRSEEMAAITAKKGLLTRCFRAEAGLPDATASYGLWVDRSGTVRRVDVTDANFVVDAAMPCVRRVFRAMRMSPLSEDYARIEVRLSVPLGSPAIAAPR